MLKGPASFDHGVFLAHLQKGKEYFDQNQLHQARAELEAAREMRPRDEKVLNMLGMTYFKLDMLPEAEEMYSSLAANNPDIYTLQSNLGLIQLKLEKLDEARDSLIRALELQPTNPKAHFYLGLLYEKQEKWADALAHFEHARADKMSLKMQEKMQEERAKREEVLPFQIMEVLAEAEQKAQEIYQEDPSKPMEEGEPFELPPAAIVEENTFPVALVEEQSAAILEAPPVAEQEKTLKISTEQLQKTMEKIRDEIISEQEAAPSPFANDVIAFPKPPEASLEDEPNFEHPIPEVEELIEESIVLQPQMPVAEPETLEEPEHTISMDHGNPGSALNGSFFLMEEMASDISTFLAESRPEEQPPEEMFFEDPPQISVLNVQESEELASEEGLFESPIPTPQQVENQTQDLGAESLFEKAEPVSQAKFVVEAAPEPLAAELPEELAVAEPEPVEPEQVEPEAVEPEAVEPEAIEIEAAAVVAEVQSEPTPAPALLEEIAESVMQMRVEPPLSALTISQAAPVNLDQFSRERFYVQPVVGADRFRLIDPHLLEIVISEKLICRMGSISSYTGNLQFSPWQSSYAEIIPLVQVNGSGMIFVADRRKEVFIISLNNEQISVEANHLLVAQSVLSLEPQIFQEKPPATDLAVMHISGGGTLALTCRTKPLTLKVHENLPVNIPSNALMAWSGRLQAELIQDDDLRRVMMSPDEKSSFLRFTGSGDVIVEQGSLWGDRRAKKTNH